ncbi:MAG: histidine kinase, partial [Anaerolineaceae bacterium]|jgi:two-component system sensor histidine kinase DegS
MLDQSKAELSKLTQKNSAITGQLQQINAQFETIPRPDMRSAFMSALDVQQRMLVMRGQLEKWQSDQTNLQRYIEMLEKCHKMLLDCAFTPQAGRPGGSNVLELVINGQELVRQRLSQQMHDGPVQALSNFILQTEIATRMFDLNPTQAKEELANLRTAAMSSFEKVRGFIAELRPMMLDDLGLFPTLQRYIGVYKDQSGQEVNLIIKGQERRLESYLEVMIFRAVQELIGNSARHNLDSPVKLQTTVQIFIEENTLKVVVTDNGKGFDVESLSHQDGIGLKLIKERVDMLGGTFEIETTVGQGCKVSFQVPALGVVGKIS